MDDWHPISNAPFDQYLELYVIKGSEVHALVFPCHRTARGWVMHQRSRWSWSIPPTGVPGPRKGTAEFYSSSRAESLVIALSSASGPSSTAPVICPRSAILHNAAASMVDGIFDVTVSTADNIATFGVLLRNACASSMAF